MGYIFRRFLSPERGSLVFLVLVLLARHASSATEEDDYYDDYEPDEDEEDLAVEAAVAKSITKRAGMEYYEFITVEYSYWLWAAFMIYDIVCAFYACLVAAYFGEVNTLAPTQVYDYDYLVKRSIAGTQEEVINSPPINRVISSINAASMKFGGS